jgi:hypothetical protein
MLIANFGDIRGRLIRANHRLDPQVRAILDRLDVKAVTGAQLQDDLDNAAEVIEAFTHTVTADWRRRERGVISRRLGPRVPTQPRH